MLKSTLKESLKMKYKTYQNTDGSYTTYEDNSTSSFNPLTFLVGIIAVYFLLPFSPILFFVTRHFIKKYSNHPKIKWLKIANVVTLVVSLIMLAALVIGLIAFIIYILFFVPTLI